MNRLKKEEIRKRQAARKGKTSEEIAELDQLEATDKALEKLCRTIHAEKFPEEYDFMYDSVADADDRRRGINPMSVDYIQRANAKRIREGVTPLADDGTSQANDTWEMALEEARKKMRLDSN